MVFNVSAGICNGSSYFGMSPHLQRSWFHGHHNIYNRTGGSGIEKCPSGKDSSETLQLKQNPKASMQEALAIRRIFSLVDMITKTKFSNSPNDF